MLYSKVMGVTLSHSFVADVIVHIKKKGSCNDQRGKKRELLYRDMCI